MHSWLVTCAWSYLGSRKPAEVSKPPPEVEAAAALSRCHSVRAKIHHRVSEAVRGKHSSSESQAKLLCASAREMQRRKRFSLSQAISGARSVDIGALEGVGGRMDTSLISIYVESR